MRGLYRKNQIAEPVEKWRNEQSRQVSCTSIQIVSKNTAYERLFSSHNYLTEFSLNLKVVSAFFRFFQQIYGLLILTKFKKSHFYGFFVDCHENKVSPPR